MTTQSPPLDEFMLLCQQRVNGLLESSLTSIQPSEKLQDAMRYACLDGGKRIRPVLAYGSALAVEAELADADAAACAVELIHSYSLAHDDLPAMDDDDLRRGKPSLHRTFDDATAILVGDALQTLAFQILSKPREQSAGDQQLSMIQLLAEAAGARGMVAGQSLDFEAMTQNTSLEQLETLHRLKTGALIRASVLMGAMSGSNLNSKQSDALSDYADAIGLAFQVRDDILDEISDTSTLGKPQGSDRQLNKTTYVTLLGLEGARSKAEELTRQAIDALTDFPPSADRLRDIAQFLAAREH